MNNYEEIDFDMIDINLIILLFFFISHILFIYGAYNKHLLNDDDEYDDENNKDEHSDQITSPKKEPKKQPQISYEEKYLTKVRGMKNEYVFTDKELEMQETKLRQLEKEENNKKLESIYVLNEKIEELNMKLSELTIDDTLSDISKPKIKKDESIMKKIQDSIESEIKLNNTQLQELQEESSNSDDLKEKAQQYIIDEQLKQFKNKYIIEHTPLGNVLMFYNHDKLAFDYYSDLTIPYRYLETVVRKYVITYNYRPLYIDMEEELKHYERKLDEKEKQMKQLQELQENEKMNPNSKSKPKDIFAKFKSYNKEAGTGRVNTAPPPKNSIPQNRMANMNLKDSKKDGNGNEKMLLKERANRYSYQGKFLNFNILQKVDKKVVDKKYALTFADFKKMNKL
jgi:hypothetical protein